MTNTMNTTIIARNYRKILKSAKPADIATAATWYVEAESIARSIADDVEVGASVIAAFSPRQRWSTNVRMAQAFMACEDVRTLGNNLRMAANALNSGFDALKGLKTNAFARAIAGDTEAVVIDVWMMRAAGFEHDSPNVTQYRMASDAVRRVAGEWNIDPRTMQALIWILQRGEAF
jgi:hypothetical protein